MNYFVNYKDGQLSINSHRFPDALDTEFDDVIYAVENKTEQVLTASIETDVQLEIAKEYIGEYYD